VILFGKIICHHQRNSAYQLKFMLKKETAESTKEEVKDIEEQINNLFSRKRYITYVTSVRLFSRTSTGV
jgi:hypothetical protein